MVNQQYFIPVIPDSAPIVVHTSQGDYDAADSQGRLCFNLVYDGIAYDTDSAVARIQGTKPDGTVFGYDAEVDGSVVRVKLTSQMTAVPGRVVCNLVLTNDDGAIGTFVIWLEVQSSALDPNADISHTEIPALIDLAQEEAQRAEDAADRAEDAADLAESWSQNPPYIGLNGHWFVYDVSTETFVDSNVDARGRNGSKWYYGTVISGKSSTPTAFPSSGITYAYENDAYLNKTEGAIYHCTLEGNASTAKWVYDMTLSGGGGGATVLSDLTDVVITALSNGQLLQYDSAAGKWKNVTLSPGGATALANLTDVDLTSLQNGQLLQYDSTAGKWKNVTLSPGGATTLAALSDVDLNSLADGEILQYDSASGKWINVAPTSGGHTMISVSGDIGTLAGLTDGDDDYVVNAYTIKRWSNCDVRSLLTTVAQGVDTIGTWVDDWKASGASRVGWLWSADLYQVLEDGSGNPVLDVEVAPVFLAAEDEVVGLYEMRIDDDVSNGGTPGGAVAFKFTGPIQDVAGAVVGVKLIKQRINVNNFTVLS